MSQGILYTCDRVMDEFGSTCPHREYVGTASIETARRVAAERGWTLGGDIGQDLCPEHSGRLYRLQLAPPDNVQPIRRPDQVVSDTLAPVIPIRTEQE